MELCVRSFVRLGEQGVRGSPDLTLRLRDLRHEVAVGRDPAFRAGRIRTQTGRSALIAQRYRAGLLRAGEVLRPVIPIDAGEELAAEVDGATRAAARAVEGGEPGPGPRCDPIVAGGR